MWEDAVWGERVILEIKIFYFNDSMSDFIHSNLDMDINSGQTQPRDHHMMILLMQVHKH